jgi:ABC-type nitrate/sulfonate/bicarbonate transport system substrate-binding protein
LNLPNVSEVVVAIPDIISNSYFPAIAAVEMGHFREQGINASIRLIAPVERAYAALHDAEVHFVAGSSHSMLSAFPNWQGGKLLCAQSQGLYWFLVMRADLNAKKGDIHVVKGKRIGAAPWVGMAFKYLLIHAGIDMEKDNVVIQPVASTVAANVNFGLAAAQALEAGEIDGFWANGIGAEIAVRRGVGTIVLDVRRGDGPIGCFNYTMASIATTDRLIREAPETAAAAVIAISRAQSALKATPEVALSIAEKFFPAAEAAMIVDVVRRDLPFYETAITPVAVAGMNQFARHMGHLTVDVDYKDVVAPGFMHLWS